MKNTRIFLLAAILCTAAFFEGCAALLKNYGSLAPNDGAASAFEGYRVDPNLNYYFSGPQSYPHALLGLDKSYKLDSDLWRKIEMTPAVLKNLVSNMQQRAKDLSIFQHGFAVLDDKGNQIGIWYSPLDTRTYVKMEGERTVMIDTPPHDTYEKHEGGGRRDDKRILDK